MIELKNVSKEYPQGQGAVRALHDLSFGLRDRELVVVQGESGSGKSTLLRLLAGMESCSRGELLYAGRSTKSFKAADWAAWRSAAVGLVMGKDELFENETAALNVEIPMSLAGMSRSVRHKRTLQLLRRVGLGDRLNALPGSLTEYERRRLSVARALANDPDALLCEEPFRGLSAENAAELMGLFETVARDRLVVLFVTAEPPRQEGEVRMLRLMNGRLLSDSAPRQDGESEAESREWHRSLLGLRDSLRLALHAAKKRSAPLFAAVLAVSLALSCLGLNLSLESSLRKAEEQEQRQALTLAPCTVEREKITPELLEELLEETAAAGEHPRDGVYSSGRRSGLLEAGEAIGGFTRPEKLRDVLEKENRLYTVLQESDGSELNLYASDTSLELRKLENNGDGTLWAELPGDGSILKEQYEIVAGRWCSAWDELVLFVDENNELSDVSMSALGLSGGESGKRNFEDLCAVTFRLLLPTDYYQKGADGCWARIQDESLLRAAVNEARTLRVVGIVRPRAESTVHAFHGVLGYPAALRTTIAKSVEDSAAVREQRENPGTDIFTGLPFMSEEQRGYDNARKAAALREMVSQGLDVPVQMAIYCRITGISEADAAYMVSTNVLSGELKAKLDVMPDGDCAGLYNSFILTGLASSTYAENLGLLGASGGGVKTLRIYTGSLEQRNALLSYIRSYNARCISEGRWEDLVRSRDEAAALAAVSGKHSALLLTLLSVFAASALLSAWGLLAAVLNAACERQRGTLRSLYLLGISPSDRAGLLRTEGLLLGLCCALLGFGMSVGISTLLPAVSQSLWGLSLQPGIPWLAACATLPGGVLLGLLAAFPACRRAATLR